MKTRVTLKIDKKIIERSKKYAADHKRSLSDLVESYLQSITQNKSTSFPSTDRVMRLKGCFKVPPGFDYKKVLQEEIYRKHG